MAEVLTTFSTKSLPVFSSNQILKAEDLNALSDYMDGQNRLTRLLTIGSGIVSGLEASCVTEGNKDIIRITAGFGISSDGYLFRLTEDCDFDLIRSKINIPSSAFPCGLGQGSCYDVPWDTDEVDVWEIEAAGQGDGSGFIPLRDMPKGGNDVTTFLSDKVLIFLRCQNDEDRSPCFNECDQTGMDRTIKVRKYLLKKDDIKNFIKNEGSSQERSPLGELCIPPYMHRFGFDLGKSKFDLSAIETYSQYQENYKAITDNAISSISKSYQWAFEVMKSQPEVINNSFLNLETTLTTLAGTFSPSQNPIKGIQYFYDYLKDLILTYREFEKAFCEIILKGSFLPNQCNHPGFVSLGGISKSGQDPNDNLNSECRTNFLASQLGSVSAAELLRKPIFYFNKMVKLTTPDVITNVANTSLEIQDPANVTPIRITGDRGLNFPLSERALPYYYTKDETLLSRWSDCYKDKDYHIDNAGQIKVYNSIPSYYNQTVDPNSQQYILDSPFNQHLNYDLHHHDFFRIEGHVGKNLEDVFTKITELRKCLNLPFDIKKVSLDPKISFEANTKLDPQYLELLYQNMVCDLISTINNKDPQTPLPPALNMPDTIQELCTMKSANQDPWTELIARIEANLGMDNVEEKDCYLQLIDKLCEELDKILPIPVCYFTDYATLHCGLEHAAGVSKGGTFVMVYYTNSATQEEVVIGDFFLPYYCCGEEQIINIDNTSITETPPFIFISPCEFCVTDLNKYPILTYPTGGTITACMTDAAGAEINITTQVIQDGKFLPSLVTGFNEVPFIVTIKFDPGNGDLVEQEVVVWPNISFVENESERGFNDDTNKWTISLNINPPFYNEYIWEVFQVIQTPLETLIPIGDAIEQTGVTATNNIQTIGNLSPGKYQIQLTATNPLCDIKTSVNIELPENLGPDLGDGTLLFNSSNKPKAKTPKAKASKKTAKQDLIKKDDVAKLIRRRAAIFANVGKMMNTGNLKKEILEEYVTPTFTIPHSDFEKLEEHFETAKDFVIKEIKSKSASSQKKYFELLISMTNYYLDSLVLRSPDKVISNSKKLLTTLVKQTKALDMDTNLIVSNWKVEDLKEKFNAKSIQGYLKLF